MSHINKIYSGLTHRCKERGVAAIEFALTLPIWIALLIGTIDGSHMILLAQRVDRIVYTVTDLVTQIDHRPHTAEITTILLMAAQLMNPFPFGENGLVIVTSVTKNPGVAVKIDWQIPGGGSLARESRIGRPGFPPSLPNGLTLNDNQNVIITEVYYAYRPLFINAGIFSARDMYSIAVFKPRLCQLNQLLD
jgi:hypothetical protein